MAARLSVELFFNGRPGHSNVIEIADVNRQQAGRPGKPCPVLRGPGRANLRPGPFYMLCVAPKKDHFFAGMAGMVVDDCLREVSDHGEGLRVVCIRE